MNGSTLMIVLRLFHILGGVFWVGTAFLIAWFLIPSHRATGEAGMTFVHEVMIRQKLRVYLAVAMILTILSGLAMYVRIMMVSHGAWGSTTTAKVLGFGALCAIVAGGLGGSVGGATGAKMVALGQSIKDSGQPPTEIQHAQMEAFQDRLQGTMRLVAVLLVIAVAAMASARYL